MKITPTRLISTLALGVLSCSSIAVAQQNVTVVAVDPPDRLSNAIVIGEWATNGVLDSWSGANVTGLAASGGSLAGDDNSTTTDSTVSRTAISSGPDLDLGFNDFLQIRIKLPATYSGDVAIEYGTSVNPNFSSSRRFVVQKGTGHS